MRDKIKLVIKYLMRLVLKIFYIFPIKKKIFFMSTMGKSYSCNPKYLFESILTDERFFEYELVWCFLNPERNHLPRNQRVKIVKKKNYLLYFYQILTSKIVIYNCGGFSYIPIRKKQTLLETWHGGGTFKKVNLTVKNKSQASKKGVEIASKDIKAFIGTSKINNEMFIKNGMGYEGLILNSGFPRNDIFFGDTKRKKIEIRRKINLTDDINLVLYAPTFKGQEYKAVNIDSTYESINPTFIKESLKNRFGGNWYFATRGHQYAGELSLEGADLDLSEYPDMQELLVISDVLITDYSSSIWDFSLTGKPCFLFVPDLEKYENEERGFLTPISEWPAIYATNNEELKKLINCFDNNTYENKVNAYLKNAEALNKEKRAQ